MHLQKSPGGTFVVRLFVVQLCVRGKSGTRTLVVVARSSQSSSGNPGDQIVSRRARVQYIMRLARLASAAVVASAAGAYARAAAGAGTGATAAATATAGTAATAQSATAATASAAASATARATATAASVRPHPHAQKQRQQSLVQQHEGVKAKHAKSTVKSAAQKEKLQKQHTQKVKTKHSRRSHRSAARSHRRGARNSAIDAYGHSRDHDDRNQHRQPQALSQRAQRRVMSSITREGHLDLLTVRARSLAAAQSMMLLQRKNAGAGANDVILYVWNPDTCQHEQRVDSSSGEPTFKTIGRGAASGLTSARDCWDAARMEGAAAYNWNGQECRSYATVPPDDKLRGKSGTPGAPTDPEDAAGQWKYGKISCGEVHREMQTQPLKQTWTLELCAKEGEVLLGDANSLLISPAQLSQEPEKWCWQKAFEHNMDAWMKKNNRCLMYSEVPKLTHVAATTYVGGDANVPVARWGEVDCPHNAVEAVKEQNLKVERVRHMWLIVGIVVLSLLIIIALLCCWWLQRRKKKLVDQNGETIHLVEE